MSKLPLEIMIQRLTVSLERIKIFLVPFAEDTPGKDMVIIKIWLAGVAEHHIP